MAKVTVRPAAVDDALEIATLHIRTWQSAYRGQIPDEYLDALSVERRAEIWQNTLARQGLHRTFVGVVEGAIVGFCSVGTCRDQDVGATGGELYAIYVDAQAENQGVGSALMAAGQAYLVELGFTQATLWVLESNEHARRFYEKKGWVADGMTRTEDVGPVVIPEIRYAIRY